MDFVHLGMTTHYHTYSSAYRRAIAFRAEQLDGNPVVLVAAVVSKERWLVVHVEDKDVHVAVVVEVAISRAAARPLRRDSLSKRCRNILEFSVPHIAKDDS